SEPASSSEAAESSEEEASDLAESALAASVLAPSALAEGAPSACATGAWVASCVASLTCTCVSVAPGSTVFGALLEVSLGSGCFAALHCRNREKNRTDAQARPLPLFGCHGQKTWLMASGEYPLFCRKYSLRMTQWV